MWSRNRCSCAPPCESLEPPNMRDYDSNVDKMLESLRSLFEIRVRYNLRSYPGRKSVEVGDHRHYIRCSLLFVFFCPHLTVQLRGHDFFESGSKLGNYATNAHLSNSTIVNWLAKSFGEISRRQGGDITGIGKSIAVKSPSS